MEKNANYALVGLSSLILFIGMVIFVVWLARVSFAQEYDLYDIVFDGPVRGNKQAQIIEGQAVLLRLRDVARGVGPPVHFE